MKTDTIWRGAYGDRKPVEIAREFATKPDGALKEDHFESEIQAWGGILSAVNSDADVAIAAHQRALAECVVCRRAMNPRQHEVRQVEAAFRAWSDRQAAVAV